MLKGFYIQQIQMIIKHLTKSCIGKQVSLQGWIVHIRFSGKIGFIELRDGTGYIQAILEKKNLQEQQREQIKQAWIETSLELTWTVKKHPKKDELELHVDNLKIFTLTQNYPIWQKEHWIDFLFDNRHLHLRAKRQIALQKIRHTIYYAITDFFNSRNFTRFDTPIFTPTIAEDSTALYSVEHPSGEIMYLNQSWQLYLEAAIHGHRYVYDFGPVFRAERSKTRRHLNELWMMDAEMAFMDFRQSMELQEQLVYHIIQEVLKKHRQDLELLWRDISKLENIKLPFIRKTYKEVIEELQKIGVDIKYWEDLGADEEKILMEKYDQPVFVTNYPLQVKAFYMPEDPDNPGTAKNSDLLAPEGYWEIIGWSERIWDYETLKQRILERGYNLDDYKWYLDLRKYWGVTTSGFWLGLERTLAWITGIPHIREAIPFPRYYNRIRP